MKRQLISAAVAVALLAAAGCGTSTTDASPPSTAAPPGSAPTTTEATTTGTAPNPSSGTSSDPDVAKKLQAALDETRAEGTIPGAIVLVRSPEGTWILTSGTVGQDATAPPSPDDRTRIGSLTKTMTATILLQLVEEGKVALDDPVTDHLDPSILEGLPNADTVTLLDLAHMTSGIEPYSMSDAFQADLFADPEQPWTPDEILGYAKGTPPTFAPGAGWEYSNTNYILLGLVIEEVTGQPLSQAFQDRLFGPLGMTDTTFPAADTGAMADPHLGGITEQGQPDGETADATSWNPSEAWSAGAVVSTLADMERWAQALYTGEGILDPATQQLRRDSILNDLPPLTATSGYGIGIGDNGGWWGHDGQIPGYTSSLQHDYDTGTTVIVLTNSDIALPGVDGKPGPNPAPAISTAVRNALG